MNGGTTHYYLVCGKHCEDGDKGAAGLLTGLGGIGVATPGLSAVM